MESKALQLVMVQDEFPVGDIDGNADRILTAARRAASEGARVVVFPELALTGYPPEDLLLRPSLDRRAEQAVNRLCDAELPVALIFGLPEHRGGRLFNAAWVIDHGEVVVRYAKQHLPNYQVFDEHRYFTTGQSGAVWACDGVRIGLTICEDIWFDDVWAYYAGQGVDFILVINASPYSMNRVSERQAFLSEQASRYGVAVLYVNLHGAQDELVFDGGSMALDAAGELVASAPCFAAADLAVTWRGGVPEAHQSPGIAPWPAIEAGLYQALLQGLAGYVNRNGFRGVILGLSGGIDSALSLAIAVDALGPERVEAVMMPFHYTAEISRADAAAQAGMLGVRYRQLPIDGIYEAAMTTLADDFAGQPPDLTEQNLQARIRGILLMALSNRFGWMVLTTGNKSELAVGYATLYGDMCGGFNALKDVPKQWVYRLARYRNSLSAAIPERVITRPPSAELAPEQKDEDSLPPYETLDRIIAAYVEEDQSAEQIVASGFARDDVYKVVRLIDRNEYKRRQAPEGVRVTARGFGRDRRYPITQGWEPGI